MKHEKEIMQFLSDTFKANLSEEEWSGFLEELNSSGFSIQSLSDGIEEGVKNGVSVEQQLQLVAGLFAKLK